MGYESTRYRSEATASVRAEGYPLRLELALRVGSRSMAVWLAAFVAWMSYLAGGGWDAALASVGEVAASTTSSDERARMLGRSALAMKPTRSARGVISSSPCRTLKQGVRLPILRPVSASDREGPRTVDAEKDRRIQGVDATAPPA